MLPQLEFWREGCALVVDGARFTQAKIDGMRGAGGEYAELGDGVETPGNALLKKKVEPGSSPTAADAKPATEHSSGSDSDDELVE